MSFRPVARRIRSQGLYVATAPWRQLADRQRASYIAAMQQELVNAPAYRIEGEDRPSRWLVTCDHASNRVPDWVNGGDLGIAACDMARHIAFDVGAAGVALHLATLLDAPAVLSDFSRLV